MKRTRRPKPMGERGRTVMRVTNVKILTQLEDLLMEVKAAIKCKRRPGIQIGLDALLQFWFESDWIDRNDFLRNWKTPVVGYPNSTRQNPGQFARLKDVDPPSLGTPLLSAAETEEPDDEPYGRTPVEEAREQADRDHWTDGVTQGEDQ